MTLRVLDPGLYTLVVDFGRPHCRSLGVPVGGAADRTSLTLGNALVGNPPDAAALEFTLHGPALEAECKLACVVYGAPFELKSSRQKLRVGKTFTLQTGERLQIGGTHEGMRAYLCVAGGIQAKVVLGSRSSLGPVRMGDDLPCAPGEIPSRFVLLDWCWNGGMAERRQWQEHRTWQDRFEESCLAEPPVVLHAVDGPQASWFLNNSLIDFEAQPAWALTANPSSNRMGVRLDATPPITVPERELVSEPVCPGAVQVTNDGNCIILGVDGQTIGGYPKIAQVVAADVDKVGQIRPGQQVVFTRVSLEDAERLYHTKQTNLRNWVWRMRSTLPGGSGL